MSNKDEMADTSHIETQPNHAAVDDVGNKIFTEKVPSKHDDAIDFLRSSGDENLSFSESEATRVRWKIDLLLMPLLLVTFTLNFLDKGALSNAAVFGLKEDIDLGGTKYSWVASIFYFGYMVGQPLNAYLLHHLPVGKLLAGNVFGWGACVLLGITAKNFAAFATTRFFLGFFESIITPTCVLVTGQYYTRKEHGLRSCIWWSGNAVGTFIGDLIAYGIAHGHGPLSPWKYIFITLGGATVAWAGVLALLMPDCPWKMKFLSQREKKIAVLRVMNNHTGISSSYWDWKQSLSVFADPQAWMFFAVAFVQCIPAGGLGAFNKLILTGLGYTNLESTIYAMPEHAIQLTGIIAAGIAASYIRNCRCIVMILSNIPPLVGALLINYEPTSHKLTRLAGVYILLTMTISYIMVMSMVASNFAGMSRKTTVSAGMFVAYSAGNLVAPQLFLSSEAPRYQTGFRGMIASFVALMVLALMLMAYLTWENRKRDRKYGKVDVNKPQEDDFLNMTDRELPYFRYTW